MWEDLEDPLSLRIPAGLGLVEGGEPVEGKGAERMAE
jgi:hypothetical protein